MTDRTLLPEENTRLWSLSVYQSIQKPKTNNRNRTLDRPFLLNSLIRMLVQSSASVGVKGARVGLYLVRPVSIPIPAKSCMIVIVVCHVKLDDKRRT